MDTEMGQPTTHLEKLESEAAKVFAGMQDFIEVIDGEDGTYARQLLKYFKELIKSTSSVRDLLKKEQESWAEANASLKEEKDKVDREAHDKIANMIETLTNSAQSSLSNVIEKITESSHQNSENVKESTSSMTIKLEKLQESAESILTRMQDEALKERGENLQQSVENTITQLQDKEQIEKIDKL
ncbi:hypothetical protein M426DRAFT_24255 [Hypoxylon sp. CI-4A]|nr:hypothetical protein M426DRAFT_24255 [Hypoxylon sp. CI-4A]